MAYVQSASDGTVMGAGVTSFAVTFTSPNASACCIVVDFIYQTTGGPVTVTDSLGNTYVQIVLGQNASTGLWAGCFIATGCAAGANTVTVTAAITDIALAIHEYANIVSASAVDASGFSVFVSITQSNSPLTASASLTTGFAFDTIHAFACARIGVAVPSIPAGYTPRENTGIYDGLLSYDAQTSALPPVTQTFAVQFFQQHFLTTSAGTVIIIALKEAKQPLTPGSSWLIVGEPSFTSRPLYIGSESRHTFTRTLNSRGTASVPVYVPAGGSYAPQTGWQVYLYDQNPAGPTLVFAGKIDRVQIKWLGNRGDHIIELSVVSFEAYFDEILVPPQTFFVEEAGAIFTTLFNALAPGVPLLLGTVNAPFVVNTLACAWEKLSEDFTKLATAGAPANQGANWGVDLSTLTVFLTPPSATAAPYQIHNAQIAWESNVWEQNQQDYRNRQIVRISLDAFAQSSEWFRGNGSQQSFTLLRPAQAVTGAWLTASFQNEAIATFTGPGSDGDTITISYPQSGSTYNWTPNSPYTVGQIIIDPANHIQKVSVQGTSGGSQPTWNDTGGTTSDGPGSPNPSPFNGGVVWQDLGLSGAGGLGGSVYTLKTVIDNTQWGQVLIGTNAAGTALNFLNAVNANQAVAGQSFSWPTWENPLVNARASAGSTLITIDNKSAGAGYKASLSASSTDVSWNHPTTTGGTTGGTTVLTVAANGSSNSANLYYTPGSNVVSVPIAPTSTQSVQVQYQRAAGDCIVVEDTAAVNARAAIEGSTGEYMALLSDTSNTSNTSGLQEAQAALAAYLEIPIKWSFRVWKAGLQPGQLLDLSVVDAPYGIAALIAANGPWLVYEVSGDLIPAQPWMDQSQVAGGGHYEYTITVINAQQISDYLQFWEGLGGGSGGSGSFVGGGGGALTPTGTNLVTIEE